jgi:AcrR family transcriptional regulator
MPRIAAASIDEHVRLQTSRITAAARRAFAANGFHATDMAAIAAEVGLARNSLYRYFNNKDALLVACVREDLEPHLDRLLALAEVCPEPGPRIIAWVNLQFDMAVGPAHASMDLISDVRNASKELKQEIGRLHRLPNESLAQALGQLASANTDVDGRAAMIGGMVVAATGYALTKDAAGQELVRVDLLAAVKKIIGVV